MAISYREPGIQGCRNSLTPRERIRRALEASNWVRRFGSRVPHRKSDTWLPSTGWQGLDPLEGGRGLNRPMGSRAAAGQFLEEFPRLARGDRFKDLNRAFVPNLFAGILFAR